jgi:hypothetical protein
VSESSQSTSSEEGDLRRSNSAARWLVSMSHDWTVTGSSGYLPRYHKVVPLTHAADGFYDLRLVVRDDFDPFQVLIACVEKTGPSMSGVRVVHTIPNSKHHLAIV